MPVFMTKFKSETGARLEAKSKAAANQKASVIEVEQPRLSPSKSNNLVGVQQSTETFNMEDNLAYEEVVMQTEPNVAPQYRKSEIQVNNKAKSRNKPLNIGSAKSNNPASSNFLTQAKKQSSLYTSSENHASGSNLSHYYSKAPVTSRLS